MLFQLSSGACCRKVADLRCPRPAHKGQMQSRRVGAGLDLECAGAHHGGRSRKAQRLQQQMPLSDNTLWRRSG